MEEKSNWFAPVYYCFASRRIFVVQINLIRSTINSSKKCLEAIYESAVWWKNLKIKHICYAAEVLQILEQSSVLRRFILIFRFLANILYKNAWREYLLILDVHLVFHANIFSVIHSFTSSYEYQQNNNEFRMFSFTYTTTAACIVYAEKFEIWLGNIYLCREIY